MRGVLGWRVMYRVCVHCSGCRVVVVLHSSRTCNSGSGLPPPCGCSACISSGMHVLVYALMLYKHVFATWTVTGKTCVVVVFTALIFLVILEITILVMPSRQK